MPTFASGTNGTFTPGVTSQTFSSPSVSGSNTYGIVCVLGSAGVTDKTTGVTWNGVSMVFIDNVQTTGDRWFDMFGLANPASGVTNIVVSASTGDLQPAAVFYTSAQQTNAPDSKNVGTQSSGVSTSFSVSTTTVASSTSVIAMLEDGSAGPPSSITTGTSQFVASGAFTIADIGKTPAGSQAIVGLWGNNAAKSGIIISLAGTGSTAVAHSLSSLGAGA